MLDYRKKAVIETLAMRFRYSEALVYLKEQGMPMSTATYYRCRKKLQDKKLARVQYISERFQELHLEKVDRL
jgi:hypothetical protein